MSGITRDARIFYQNLAPEFVVMKQPIESGIAYYMNNGYIEVRDRIDGHIIEEEGEEMTQETIDCLKEEFEEGKKSFEETKRRSEQFRREVEEGRTWQGSNL